MKRSEVQTHCDRGPAQPAINVKVRSFGNLDKVRDKFKCSANLADQAIEWAWNAASRQFWEDIQDTAREIFGKNARAYSEGRSGGWLIVNGLPDLDTWSARDLGKWARLCREVKAMIHGLSSDKHILEDIEANRWAEENAEEYNFRDDSRGKIVCLADVPRCLHCTAKAKAKAKA